MTDEEIQKFVGLKTVLNWAKRVCPPDEYDQNQRKLLHHIAEMLLVPYEKFLKEEEEREKKK